MAERTAVSAGAIILCDVEGELKIALAQHQKGSHTWVLPKGHVEPGETIEQAVLREVHEEAGLSTIQLIKYLGSFLRQSLKSNGDTVQKTIHFYLAYALGKGDEVPLDKAFSQVGWFSPKEVVNLLSYESDRAFLQEHLALLFGA